MNISASFMCRVHKLNLSTFKYSPRGNLHYSKLNCGCRILSDMKADFQLKMNFHIYICSKSYLLFSSPPLFPWERGSKMGRKEGGGGEMSSRIVSKAPVIKSSLMRLPMNRNDNESSDELQVCVF